jgi:hypothetical protein
MTETVFDVWSAAYTRSLAEMAMSGRPQGDCCAEASAKKKQNSNHQRLMALLLLGRYCLC